MDTNYITQFTMIMQIVVYDTTGTELGYTPLLLL